MRIWVIFFIFICINLLIWDRRKCHKCSERKVCVKQDHRRCTLQHFFGLYQLICSCCLWLLNKWWVLIHSFHSHYIFLWSQSFVQNSVFIGFASHLIANVDAVLCANDQIVLLLIIFCAYEKIMEFILNHHSRFQLQKYPFYGQPDRLPSEVCGHLFSVRIPQEQNRDRNHRWSDPRRRHVRCQMCQIDTLVSFWQRKGSQKMMVRDRLSLLWQILPLWWELFSIEITTRMTEVFWAWAAEISAFTTQISLQTRLLILPLVSFRNLFSTLFPQKWMSIFSKKLLLVSFIQVKTFN